MRGADQLPPHTERDRLHPRRLRGRDPGRRAPPPGEEAPQAPVRASDPALLCYTSGTTGRPRAPSSPTPTSSPRRSAGSTRWAPRRRRVAVRPAALPHRRHQRDAAVPRARRESGDHAHHRLRPRSGRAAHGAPRRDHVHLRPDAVGPGDRGRAPTHAAARGDVGRRSRLTPDPGGAGPHLPGRRHRQRLWPDRDVRRNHAPQRRRFHAQDGLRRPADAGRRAARRQRRRCST